MRLGKVSGWAESVAQLAGFRGKSANGLPGPEQYVGRLHHSHPELQWELKPAVPGGFILTHSRLSRYASPDSQMASAPEGDQPR